MRKFEQAKIAKNRNVTESLNICSVNWSDIPKYRFTFEKIADSNLTTIQNIHPLKQAIVDKVYRNINANNCISRVYIFGSSTDMRCHIDSDIDIAILLNVDSNTNTKRNEISELVQNACDWNADIIWLNDLTENEYVYHDITGGVRII